MVVVAKQELTIIKAVIELKRIEWIFFQNFCTQVNKKYIKGRGITAMLKAADPLEWIKRIFFQAFQALMGAKQELVTTSACRRTPPQPRGTWLSRWTRRSQTPWRARSARASR